MQQRIEELERKVAYLYHHVGIGQKKRVKRSRSRSKSPARDRFHPEDSVHVTRNDRTQRLSKKRVLDVFGRYGKVLHCSMDNDKRYCNIRFELQASVGNCLQDKESLRERDKVVVEAFTPKNKE
jgi:hypothetical protein